MAHGWFVGIPGIEANVAGTCRRERSAFPVKLNTEKPNFQLAPHHQLGPCPLCSYLKHDFAWSMVCGAMFEAFACAGER